MLGLAALGAVVGLKAFSKGTSGEMQQHSPADLTSSGYDVFVCVKQASFQRQEESALMCSVFRSAVSQDTVHHRPYSVLQPVQQHAAHPEQGARCIKLLPPPGVSGLVAAARFLIASRCHWIERRALCKFLRRWQSPLCQRRPSSSLASWQPAPPLSR